MQYVKVCAYHDGPECLKLSWNGGDEDYLIIAPEEQSCLGEDIAERMYTCDYDFYKVKRDGWKVKAYREDDVLSEDPALEEFEGCIIFITNHA
jgi:hypothetical protein